LPDREKYKNQNFETIEDLEDGTVLKTSYFNRGLLKLIIT
jgi:hypothetical protein